MKEEFQAEKEISIVEILRALLSKIVYLILALILGAAAGGIYGYYSSKDVKVYGANVEFYVNPSTDGGTATGESIYATYGSYSTNVMRNMVNLLESEIFAGYLIDGVYKSEKTITIEYDNNTKSADLQAVCAQSFANGGYSPIQTKTSKGTTTSKLIYYFDDTVNVDLAKQALDVDIDAAQTAGGKLEKAIITNVVSKAETTDISSLSTIKVKGKTVQGIPSVEQKWTDATQTKLHDDYKDWIKLISDAITFSFEADGNIAESFIKVEISLDSTKNNNQGEITAIALCEQIKLVVPAFVEENMPTPSNYAYTKCTPTKLIADVDLTNVSYATSQMTKLALIAGVISLVVAAIVVIAMYLSDKRLRDIEVLPKSFNIPILGVIPSISEVEMKKMRNDHHKGGNV